MKKYLNHVLFLSSILADRLTKLWALNNLSYDPLPVCYGMNLQLAWNRGISWGFFSPESKVGFYVLLVFILTVISAFTFYIRWRVNLNKSVVWEFIVFGGAVSNVIDRLWHRAVLDFIDLYIGPYHWPVFNVADILIVIGDFGIFLRNRWSSDE